MKGTLVNSGAIVFGSLIGLLLQRGISARYQKTMMQALGLATGLIGIQMALKTNQVLIVVVSLVLGALIGEGLNIERQLNRLGAWLSDKIGSRYGDVGKGFVTASLLYCVGAMAVVGSIQDGLANDAQILYTKAIIDGVAAVMFAAALGIGVAISSVSVLLYQGAITILAVLFADFLSPDAIAELSAVGGILIVGISIVLLEIKEIKVGNLLPAIPIAVLIVFCSS